MSRPRQVVMEGEDAGPSYGAVNGVPAPPPRGDSGGLFADSVPRREQDDMPSSSTSVTQQATSKAAMPIAPPTGPGANDVQRAPDDVVPKSAQHIHAQNVQSTASTQQQQQPTLPPVLPLASSKQTSSTQPLPASTPVVGDRLPQPLQSAVQQLSQQRSAVIQAVQNRAQRALQGRRSEETVNDGAIFASSESLVGSPQVTSDVEREGERSSGTWSVTRISEVLHRRIVAPMMGQGPIPSPPQPPSSWQSPLNASGRQEQPLMSPESRRAMAAWTARPSLLTSPAAPENQQNDDSSAASVNHELVMEEVRKQVQLAMQGRDAELQALKIQNEDLKRALDTSAQLLNDVVQAGGGEPGLPPREARRGDPGREPGQTSLSGGGGPSGVPSAPPGLVRPDDVSGGIPCGRGLGEPARGLPREPLDRSRPAGGIQHVSSVKQGVEDDRFEPLSGDRVPRTTMEMEADASPLDLLVQGMRQLQQVYLDKKGSAETETMKGSLELQALPDLLGETGVEFSDWLYVAEQTVGSLSDSAASWFEKTLKCAKEAYQKHQLATPMERLSIAPTLTAELRDHKWNRLERRVMTMLLSAMPRAVRDDAVTHRVATVAGALFRLHVLYAPGGVAERTAVLKQLEGSQGTDNVVETIAALRRWRRNLTRASEMNVSPPDASVLLKGVESIAGTAVKKNHDMSFRLALTRNELQLQHRPTQETVLRYYDHLLSELQQSMPARSSGRSQGLAHEGQPQLRAVGGQAGTGEMRTPSSSPTKAGGKQGTPCRFFVSDAGCRRGANCKYSHDFPSKEEKRARCWHCGSKQHRQGECPVKDPSKAQKQAMPSATNVHGSTNAASTTGTTPAIASIPEPKAIGPTSSSTASTLTSSSTSGGSVVAGEPIQPFTPEALQNPELQNFMKEVNVMLQRFSRLNKLTLINDAALATQMRKLETELSEGGTGNPTWALLDSGATNPFRPANDGEELDTMPVQVQLADGQAVLLRQNRAGTLMPYSRRQAAEKGTNTVIVPLGSLVQELGCSVQWTRRGLEVNHPTHGVITTHVSGACPFIGESRALELIGELENKKLEQLKISMLETQLRLHGVEAQLNYVAQLAEYRRTGERTHGLKALMCEDSAFGSLTEAQRCMLIQDIDLSDKAGHKYLKALPIKRAMRRRLMSTQWLVHLYSGEGGSAELKVLEDDCVTLLEVDLGLSKAFNMKEPSHVYRALLWAAMRGQLHGLVGGPPRGDGCGELVLKQMFLWNVARVTAEEHEVACPMFAMSMPTRSELWSSPMWKQFRLSQGLSLNFGNPAVAVASNLVLRDGSDLWEQPSRSGAITWTPEFRRTLAEAILHRRARVALFSMNGPLSSMSREELSKWTMHVRNGHIPYNKRCKTCVASRATGHQHRKIQAPSCYVMSLDVCGPFRKKGHTPDGLDFRYMLVASYTMPVLEGRKCQPEDEIINGDGGGVGELEPPGDLVAPPDSVQEPPGDLVAPPDSVQEPPGDLVAPPDSVQEPPGDLVAPLDSDQEPRGDLVAPLDSVQEPPGDLVAPPDHIQELAEDPVFDDDCDMVPSHAADLDDLFVEEEGEDGGPLEPGDQEEWDRLNKEYNDLVAEIGDKLDYQVLRFAVPMRSRRTVEVNNKVRQLYLQIRAEGLPVVRCHSDRARELCNHKLRAWLLGERRASNHG